MQEMTPQAFFDVMSAATAVQKELGITSYAVGGAVRNLLLNKPVTDLDLVVDAVGGAEKLAGAIAKRLKDASQPSVINALDTVELRVNGFTVQLSDAERNSGLDISSVYAPVSDSMKADVLRRDFTVNTLLLPVAKPKPTAVIDPLSIGLPDLRRMVLRTPLKPEETLAADPIRMLRAIRFGARDGFSIDEDLEAAIRELAERIAVEPGERIGQEFTRIITSDRPAWGVSMMIDYGLMHYIFPDIEYLATVDQPTEYHGDDVLNHTLNVLSNTEPVLRLRLAALLHDVGKAQTRKVSEGKVVFHGHQYASAEKTKDFLERLRYPRKLIGEVVSLVEMHMIAYRSEWSDKAVRRLVRKAGGLLDDLLLLYRADIRARAKPHDDLSEFNHLMERIKMLDLQGIVNVRSPLKGEEVMKILGIGEGPEIGEAQEAVEQAIVDGIIPATEEAASAYLKQEYLPRRKGRKG